MAFMLAGMVAAAACFGAPSPPKLVGFAVRVVDDKTGRAVPLISLETTSHTVGVTDSAGVAFFTEPELLTGGQLIFLSVVSSCGMHTTHPPTMSTTI